MKYDIQESPNIQAQSANLGHNLACYKSVETRDVYLCKQCLEIFAVDLQRQQVTATQDLLRPCLGEPGLHAILFWKNPARVKETLDEIHKAIEDAPF